jgi:GDP-4-dehydro-6-deoxy-D-mannose reductase
MLQTVVITGGKGFVGRHLERELKENKYRVVIWDKPEVDITKSETYREELKKIKPEWVVHLAAIASVGQSLKEEELTYRVNVEGTRRLLETVQEVSPVTKVLVVSTADIYGQGSSTPLPELKLAECRPKNPYAQSKWQMEKIIEENFLERVIVVRPFPHIGPGQSKGFVTADFASQLATGGEVMRVGNLEARRDFTDVRDVVRAYRLLLERGELGEVYNIASGRAVSVQEILEKLIKISGRKVRVEQDPDKLRPSDVPISVGDASKLKKTTGWEREISFEQSLQDIWEYWRKRVG